jgi:hypothetical protein
VVVFALAGAVAGAEFCSPKVAVGGEGAIGFILTGGNLPPRGD